MKKSPLKSFFVLSCLFVLAGCTQNVVPVNKIIEVTENEEIPDTLITGEAVSSSDYVLKVTPRSDGLLIEKNHDSSWVNNTIKIVNLSKSHENASITSAGPDKNTFLYPFVKKGDRYEISIVHMDSNWQHWGESNKVKVESIGGIGNYMVTYRKFEYSSNLFTLRDLTFTRPKLENVNPYFNGTVFQGALWGNSSRKPSLTVNSKGHFDLSEISDFLTGQNKLSMSLSYDFSYNGVNYSCSVFSDTFYQSWDTGKRISFTNSTKELPKVYITTASGWVDNATYHVGSSWVDASISIDSSDFSLATTDIQIKDRGNSTKWTTKTPFSIKFDEKVKVLGMKKAKRWVLMANYFDRSLIRTEFAGYLGNNVFNSYWNASFIPVNLYVNNRFIGTYDWGECNKIAKQRINIQSLKDYADNDAEYTDVNNDGKVDIEDAGFMVEIDTATNWDKKLTISNYKTEIGINSGAERVYFYSSEYCIPMTLKEPDFDDYTYSDEDCEKYGEYAKVKIDAFEKMLVADDFESHLEEYIDITSFCDWYLINEFGKNSDANFQKSVPVTYNPATGKLYMGPNWDFDLAFGNFNHSYSIIGGGSSTVDDPTGWYIHNGVKGCDENSVAVEHHGAVVQSFWINRLFESNKFKKAVKNRWLEKRSLLKNGVTNKIGELAGIVAPNIPANEEINPRLGKESWNGPSGYGNRVDYVDEIDYLYKWCLARYNWMDKEINKW